MIHVVRRRGGGGEQRGRRRGSRVTTKTLKAAALVSLWFHHSGSPMVCVVATAYRTIPLSAAGLSPPPAPWSLAFSSPIATKAASASCRARISATSFASRV